GEARPGGLSEEARRRPEARQGADRPLRTLVLCHPGGELPLNQPGRRVAAQAQGAGDHAGGHPGYRDLPAGTPLAISIIFNHGSHRGHGSKKGNHNDFLLSMSSVRSVVIRSFQFANQRRILTTDYTEDTDLIKEITVIFSYPCLPCDPWLKIFSICEPEK